VYFVLIYFSCWSPFWVFD